jgi:8-oxo-dGTP diphosphatase
MQASSPVPAVGVVCLRDGKREQAEVLLIRRGKAPRQGEWSLPGGRIEWGERAIDAALRELTEETGVVAEITELLDVIDGFFQADSPDDHDRHYVLVDYAAEWLSGEPRAGDDASEAMFVPIERACDMVAWDETRRIILLAAALRAGVV